MLSTKCVPHRHRATHCNAFTDSHSGLCLVSDLEDAANYRLAMVVRVALRQFPRIETRVGLTTAACRTTNFKLGFAACLRVS